MNSIIKQYQSIKAKYPDAILLFRIGDHYEILGPDAKVAHEILRLELHESRETELIKFTTSFPHYSLDGHLQKLVRAGYRVAICEQLEDPKRRGKNVRRSLSDLPK